jgi:hypothetical protein
VPDFKPLDFRTEDLITVVGAMAGVNINNPDQQFIVKLALTQAQQEICGLREWKWMRSTGMMRYTTGVSTVNMHSVSAGKYKAFSYFLGMRLNREYKVTEIDLPAFDTARIIESTSSYPRHYCRFGEATIKWQPVPQTANSVHFAFYKQPGFIHGNEDIIIPKPHQLNALAFLARKKVWEMKGDPRSGQENPSYSAALMAMYKEDGMPVESGKWKVWNPLQGRLGTEQSAFYSGFYSTGNMP